MHTFANVSQQFYGSRKGAVGAWKQKTHVVSASDPDPLIIPLEGTLIPDGVINAALNGLGLNPNADYSVELRGGVSAMVILISRAELSAGDTFVISAQLNG